MAAPWQGVNQGIRAGLAIAGQVNDQKRQQKLDAERSEDRQYLRGRQEDADKRARGQDALTLAGESERQAQRALMSAAGSGGLSNEGRAEVDRLKADADALRGKGRQLLGYEQKAQEARATLDAIDAGTPIDQIPADQLGDAFSYTFGHPIGDFIDRGGKPSPVSMAIGSIYNGIERDDPTEVAAGVNFAMRPEIEQGVGQKLPNGDTIIEKFVSSIETDGRRGRAGLVVRARRPNGEEYDYDAPMTKGRKIGGEVLDFDINDVMAKRIQPYEQLLQFVNDPARSPVLAQKAQEWQKSGAAQRWRALRSEYIASGGDAKDFDAMQPKRETKEYDRGRKVRRDTVDERGNIIGTEYEDKARDPLDEKYKRAQISNLERRAAGGGKSSTGYFLVDAEGNETEWSQGDEIPPGGQVIKAGSKAQDLGPKDQRAKAEKVLQELRKDHRAAIQAAGGLRDVGPAPTMKDALKLVKDEDELFTEIDVPDDAMARLKGKAPAAAPQPAPAPAAAQPPVPKPGLQAVQPPQMLPDTGGHNTRDFNAGTQKRDQVAALQQQLVGVSQGLQAAGPNSAYTATLRQKQQQIIQQINQIQGY